MGRHDDYSPMKQTAYDLYVERDRLPWWLRTGATAASWFVVGGYVMFAKVFAANPDNLKTSRKTLTSLAAFFLLFGYGGLAGAAVRGRRAILFLFDCVLLPTLTASFTGIVVTVFNHALQRQFTIPTPAYIYVPLLLSCTTTVATAVVCGLVFRRINLVRKSDNRLRVSSRSRLSEDWRRRGYGYGPGYGDPTSTTELLPYNIPEDEAQRQQLLRLLLKRENRDRFPNASPDGTATSTYRIDMPGTEPPVEAQTSPFLSVPSSTQQQQQQHQQQHQQPREHTRSGSDRLGRFNNKLSNLVGSVTGRATGGVDDPSRPRADSGDSFKSPRERRRDQIERGDSVAARPAYAAVRSGSISGPAATGTTPLLRASSSDGWPTPNPNQN